MPEQHNVRELPPLPQRAAPQPWEDLASVLSRTAKKMGYTDLKWILQPQVLAHRIAPKTLPLLRAYEDYQVLGRLLALDEETLYRLTVHRFASLMQQPRPSEKEQERHAPQKDIERALLLAETFDHLFLPIDSTKVCPLCLDEDEGYDRLYWRVRSVVICLRHRAFLRDRCPTCHSVIPALRISLTICPTCGTGDYRMPVSVRPATGKFLEVSEAFVFKQLDLLSSVWWNDSVVFVESPLLRLLPWQYFQILRRFCSLLDSFEDKRIVLVLYRHFELPGFISFQRAGLPGRTAAYITLFHFIFTSWPERFFTFLDAIVRLVRGITPGRSIPNFWSRDTVFATYGFCNTYQHDAYSFLSAVFQGLTPFCDPSDWIGSALLRDQEWQMRRREEDVV